MARSAPRELTAPERELLAQLVALGAEVQRIQHDHAAAIALVNEERARLITELRDGDHDRELLGLPVMRQAKEIGVHYTTLFRLVDPALTPPAAEPKATVREMLGMPPVEGPVTGGFKP